MIRAMRLRLVPLGMLAMLGAALAVGAEIGGLKLDVLGGSGAGTKAGVTT